MTDRSDTPFVRCSYCGAQFRYGIDYPVVTERQNGDVTFYTFCDEECRAAWESER